MTLKTTALLYSKVNIQQICSKLCQRTYHSFYDWYFCDCNSYYFLLLSCTV